MKKKRYYLFEMNMTILNVVSLVLFFLMIALTYLFYKVGVLHNWNYPMGIILILMIPYLCFHEVLHSIAYVLNGADFKNVYYGAYIEKGVLCCLCKQNISKKNILVSLVFPFIFIGVLTYILGVLLDWPILIALSIVNLSGCSGDLVMFLGFLPIKDFEYCEGDDATSFGLYSSEDFSRRKLFGLKYIEEADDLIRTKTKKISVSRTSVVCFIIIILLGLMYTFVSF